MKKIAVLIFSGVISFGCNGANQQTVNVNVQTQNTTNSLVASTHGGGQTTTTTNPVGSTSNQMPKSSEGKTKWTQSGNPIDTTEFDADIAKAEKDLKAKPNDEATKKALSEAYFKRGVALTDARQYASALGDYRKALRLDPANADAKKWVDQIIEIYDGLNKDYPKEGEEPLPLPFKKA